MNAWYWLWIERMEWNGRWPLRLWQMLLRIRDRKHYYRRSDTSFVQKVDTE